MINRYYVNGLEKRDAYVEFIDYMVSFSDAFCLVYFRYDYKEEYSENVKAVRNKLEQYKKYERLTDEWPGTKTLNDQRHIYLYALYRSADEVKEILKEADNIYEWDYDEYPMDLCFFKDGYSFFFSSAHEEYSVLCTNDDIMLDCFSKMGLQTENMSEKSNDPLFYDEVALKGYDIARLPEEYKANTNELCKAFSTTVGSTDKYRFVTDNDKLFAVDNETGTKIPIAECEGIDNYKSKSLFQDGELLVALSQSEYSGFFSDNNSSGIWAIDGGTLGIRKIVEGEYSAIAPGRTRSEIQAYDDEMDFYFIDINTGAKEKIDLD